MKIIKDLVSENKYSLKCPYKMTPAYIVIHNTSNDASAKNEVSYMKNSSFQTSFHFAVDDVEARQGIALERNAWHAGDGTKGAGNRRGIGIEICYSKSGGERFAAAEENAAALTALLLKEYGWDISRVKKHQDFSGKYCPHRTLDLGWNRFLDKVKKYMDFEKRITALEKKTENITMVYAGVDVPDFAKQTITKLVNKGLLKGDLQGNLKLSEDMIRLLVINDRAGLYD